jgi:DNA-directed RNA polymerase specialized sigma24 family protein
MDNPAAYARKILVNGHTSHRRLRRNQETPSASMSGSISGSRSGSGMEASVAADDPGLRLTLLDGLSRLATVDRAVLVLRYWEDLDVNTTADLLRISPANVRTRSVRALERLRALLGDDLVELRPGRAAPDREAGDI